MPKLKVFCATSGFHDAIVAVSSKSAALKAWGANTDLFSMGVAHLVTDPMIAKKALDRPGEVIRLKRSGGGEEVASPKKLKAKPKKPPSRAKLEGAEKRLAELETEQSHELAKLDRQLQSLQQKRDGVAARQSTARRSAEKKLDDARERYEAALADWDG